MKSILLFISVLLIAVNLYCNGNHLKLATTTSTDNSGLLDKLIPPFEKKFNIKVDVISVGTGKALKLGENGDVDVVLVHARKAENEFLKKGFGVNRRDVMHNDFIIVGPKGDPANIKSAKTLKEAVTLLVKSNNFFVSRGDDSGTNKKEGLIWKKTGLKPNKKYYKEAGQGMGAVLRMASELQGYTLSDRGTYLYMKDKLDLKICFEKKSNILNNPYGVIAVNPSLHKDIKYLYAMEFIAWITSVPGQKIIKNYKIKGQQLFVPDAVK